MLNIVFTQLNGFKYCYRTLIIQFNIDHLSAYVVIVMCREERDRGLVRLTDILRALHLASLTGALILSWFSDRKITLLHPGWRVNSLAAFQMTDCLTLRARNIYLFSVRQHIFLLAQFMGFISAVPCLPKRHRCNILFWNPQLTCCQRSVRISMMLKEK